MSRISGGCASAYLIAGLAVEQDPSQLDHLGRVLCHIHSVLIAGRRDVDDDVPIELRHRCRRGCRCGCGHGGLTAHVGAGGKINGSERSGRQDSAEEADRLRESEVSEDGRSQTGGKCHQSEDKEQ